MAMLGDTPGEEQEAPPMFDPGALAQEWRAWMAEPANRAAMLQTGLALMQPMGIGQSPAGHFGGAIGAGGEAAARVVASDRADAEAERKNYEAVSRGELRTAQAETGALNAENKRISAEAQAQNARTRQAAMESQRAVYEARARELDARIIANQEKAKNDRDNVQLKREAARLARDKMENDTRLRELALGIQADRSETYRRSVEQRGEAARESTDQKLTATRDKAYKEYQENFRFSAEGRKKGAAPLTREQWDQQNPISRMPGRGSSLAPSGGGGGGPPGTVRSATDAAGNKAYQLASGEWVDEDGNPVE